jgi:hypothetical protein
MRSRKLATARHCRRVLARVYPAIRDGWPAGARKQIGLAGVLTRRHRQRRPQSSSDSRITATAFGFFILTQSVERPLRKVESLRFETMPSRPAISTGATRGSSTAGRRGNMKSCRRWRPTSLTPFGSKPSDDLKSNIQVSAFSNPIRGAGGKKNRTRFLTQISSQSITNAGTGRRRKNAAPEDSAERKFYTRQLQGIRFSREEAGQAAKAADSIQPFPLRLIQLA